MHCVQAFASLSICIHVHIFICIVYFRLVRGCVEIVLFLLVVCLRLNNIYIYICIHLIYKGWPGPGALLGSLLPPWGGPRGTFLDFGMFLYAKRPSGVLGPMAPNKQVGTQQSRASGAVNL